MDIEDQMQRDTTITAFAVADADQVRVVPGPTSMQAARSRKHLNIGAWNVRSCKLESTQLLLARELQKYKINVCCLSETRLNDVLSKKLTVSAFVICQKRDLMMFCPKS
jgi:precorrin-6B methylase 1